MGYVVYVVDTETTGLDPINNEVIEVSMCRLFLDVKDSNEEIKTWLLQAVKPETIEDAALKISGHKREDILNLSKFGKENYIHPKKVLPDIENWIMQDNMAVTDRVMVGQNVLFDYNMLNALWKRHDAYDTFPFQTGPNKFTLDTKDITVLIDLCTGKKRERYNLGSLVKSFGVKSRKAHRAEEDVIMTKDLLLTQLAPLKEVLVEAFKNCYDK